MDRFLRGARLVVDAGLALMALGLGGLIVLAWVEYVRTPGISLVDGYWMGREPWTSLGVWSVLIGSVVTTVVGALVAIFDGSWIRKLLALVAVAVSGLWWLAAFGVIPYPRYRPIDPSTFAYSLPETAAVLVVLPALVAAALALAPRRTRPSSRMAPVHGETGHRPSP